jgi:hypothetical protein
MDKRQTAKTRFLMLCVIAFGSLFPHPARPASLDDVTFLTRVEDYETIVDTALTTQEGKRIPLAKGTRLNVAGFTATEAFVISRLDKPNGFVRKADIAPVRGQPRLREGTIKEEPLK